MSEPSPKRHKVDDNEVIPTKIVGLVPGEGPADANGDLEGAPDYAVEFLGAELEECQKALDKVNDEASDRVLAVEQEYNKKRRPIYAERAEIIKKIPHFWHRVLSSHPTLADQLSDDDAAILEYVTELDVVDFDDIKSGFKIVLSFSADNPYFSNPTLTKSFHYGESDGKVTTQPATINWSEGHAPTVPGLDGQFGPSYLFFTWMATSEPVGAGTPDEIAEVIKDEIWPNPVKYYFSQTIELEDEVAVMEGEELEGLLVQGALDEGEGEEEELLYDEGEGELGGARTGEGEEEEEEGGGFPDNGTPAPDA
ncbi:hypothetical protein VOLCADRAFT_79426 [Volvox carteri f. nagariensis]|uniref:Nucleosome assembly protein n=1 Tax=Volvox carteri f. nagariensis TaxID=3068 RepID=D8TKF8_VOLCA|nr:uncharacterized protein VOLCADRAFT_79426 [Volvox carteri f. nagariensis]EFJ52054.1 hypothetical protein VOLCADRAFT_79426 [Volvox carteri f. nagariensis]|eukprot:XP_002946828.1 hypothetical protein VOLCADRAFT_79426 [Volvox carteri f. nagariensis]